MQPRLIQPGGMTLRRREPLTSGPLNPFAGDTLHLDASKGLTIDGVTSDAAAWADIERGVHSAVQATDAKQPTPGVGPSHLDFDSGDWLNVPDDAELQIANAQEFSIMFGLKVISGGTVGGAMFAGAVGKSNAAVADYDGFDTLIAPTNAGEIFFRVRDDNNDLVTAGASFKNLIGDGWNVFAGVMTWGVGGTLAFYKNGGTARTGDTSSLTGAMPAGNGLTIGKRNDGTGTSETQQSHAVFDRRAWSTDELNRRGRAMARAVGTTWTNVS